MAEMIKTNRKKCKQCIYGTGAVETHNVSCEYLFLTGKRRACPVGLCDKFEEKGKKVQDGKIN